MLINSTGFTVGKIQHYMNYGKFKSKTVSVSYWIENGKTMNKIQVFGTKIVTKIRNLKTDKFERVNR